ncbi:MAG TPA: ATP-dependent RecD-like DNA helicase [Chitinispirillaceae bacterium]|jgi:exodeoxyribonuclease V alpha subunit|nr:ATP-dependent RecD-like DNA helicase [Chitinispirillaceae bacterium]
MVTLTGIVNGITFQNEDSGFTVVQLQTESSPILYTCVGVMPTVAPGESIQVEGEWESHRKFGKQFNVKTYQLIRPTTLEGIGALLGSGLFTNIGPVRSKAIIERFGRETLDILDREPERLMEVPGIGKKTYLIIKESWDRQKHLRNLMMFLREYDVSVNMVMKIFKAYGEQAGQKISENPYCLVEDIWGVGFKKADRIAQKMGFAHDSYKRIRAGLIFVIQEASSDGHTFLPAAELVSRASEILEVAEEKVTYSLDHAVDIKLLIRESDKVYLPLYYYAEKYIADSIQKKLHSGKTLYFTYESAGKWLEEYSRKSGWRGDDLQVEGIRMAACSPLFLLTGGPGTGKTTILQVLVSLYLEHNFKVILAAPTGRAAQKMGSVAGIKAGTIHRLLEFKPGSDGFRFGKNEENPLDADVVILDEVSMIDVLLMRQFLSALRPETQLLLVGDNNQLPSVGAGNVLGDLLDSSVIPHICLKTVFRQAAASRIVTAAHEIISGKVPLFTNSKQDNCFFMNQSDPQAALETIVDLVSRRLPSRYGFNPVTDIQVLSPMHKGILGTENLNAALQKELNKNSRFISRGQYRFSVGDKVMQVRNNYDLGVFNGDIGTIVAITEDMELQVDIDGSIVSYSSRDIDELMPAYCISIHKSQGCEFKAVIIPVSTQHFVMLQRNLIYTALTRARQLCVFIGTMKALSIAVNNNNALTRYSSLRMRLSGY